LISTRRHGREQLVTAEPATLISVEGYLADYEKLWHQRFDALETLLNKRG
jgi:hypothetical protein